MQDTENANEWIKWIEEVDSDKKYFKFYEYKQFNNIQHVGTGNFGKVFRANWKDSEKKFTLKIFLILKRLFLKIQQEVDFHDIATE
ncbi:kinase-like domain-containing protein [Rhizophagus irregularis DAOM 181602=DAOM 197198]|nr:kinase-like domain-containing protein [Rhizophagus irregularis DAOM 181602=DAOM 197198]